MENMMNKNTITNTKIINTIKDKNFCMLPFDRPASPWKKGAVVFLSTDGKFVEYEPEKK